jgi:methylisocitrate lyase
MRHIVRAAGHPLLVTALPGETLNVMHMVCTFEEAGAGAEQIEDQVLPTKCGHLNGKRLLDANDMGAKDPAAVKTRGDPVIIGRADAVAIAGVGGAIARAKLDIDGADAISAEALTSKEVPGPRRPLPVVKLLANMTEFARAPNSPM